MTEWIEAEVNGLSFLEIEHWHWHGELASITTQTEELAQMLVALYWWMKWNPDEPFLPVPNHLDMWMSLDWDMEHRAFSDDTPGKLKEHKMALTAAYAWTLRAVASGMLLTGIPTV